MHPKGNDPAIKQITYSRFPPGNIWIILGILCTSHGFLIGSFLNPIAEPKSTKGSEIPSQSIKRVISVVKGTPPELSSASMQIFMIKNILKLHAGTSRAVPTPFLFQLVFPNNLYSLADI
mmetsp:Transcript_17407/g.2874  ORF Transcript_17407/g.2874 Transcript_17407/m.2874 type:complete len:120 (-) Transcript_17407:1197-1556(-)